MVSRLLLLAIETKVGVLTMRFSRIVEIPGWPMIPVDEDIFTHEKGDCWVFICEYSPTLERE